MKSIAIIQHADKTPPGTNLLWAKQKQIQIKIYYPYKDDEPANDNTRSDSSSDDKSDATQFGGKFPNIEKYDGFIILGGGMNVDQENDFPWLKQEKLWISDVLESTKPVLGLCLGAQLLAESLGARVGKHYDWEIGWQEIIIDVSENPRVLPQMQAEISVRGPQYTLNAFQFHGYSFDTPIGAERIATNEFCCHQGFILNDRVAGFQFHPEADQDWINKCAAEVDKLIQDKKITQTNEKNIQSREKIISLMNNQVQMQDWYFKFLDRFFSVNYR